MPPYDYDETFDDFDLDDLPNDALEELESNAIHFTQAQLNEQASAHIVKRESSDYGDDFGDDDLDNNVVIDESRSTPALNPSFQPRQSTQHNKLPQRSASKAPSGHAKAEGRSARPPPLFNESQLPSTLPQGDARAQVHGSQLDKVAELQRQLDEVGLYATRSANCILKTSRSHEREMPSRKILVPRLARLP